MEVVERDLLTVDVREVAAACAASAARISSSCTSAAEKVCPCSLSESRSSVNFEAWDAISSSSFLSFFFSVFGLIRCYKYVQRIIYINGRVW